MGYCNNCSRKISDEEIEENKGLCESCNEYKRHKMLAVQGNRNLNKLITG